MASQLHHTKNLLMLLDPNCQMFGKGGIPNEHRSLYLIIQQECFQFHSFLFPYQFTFNNYLTQVVTLGN